MKEEGFVPTVKLFRDPNYEDVKKFSKARGRKKWDERWKKLKILGCTEVVDKEVNKERFIFACHSYKHVSRKYIRVWRRYLATEIHLINALYKKNSEEILIPEEVVEEVYFARNKLFLPGTKKGQGSCEVFDGLELLRKDEEYAYFAHIDGECFLIARWDNSGKELDSFWRIAKSVYKEDRCLRKEQAVKNKKWDELCKEDLADKVKKKFKQRVFAVASVVLYTILFSAIRMPSFNALPTLFYNVWGP